MKFVALCCPMQSHERMIELEDDNTTSISSRYCTEFGQCSADRLRSVHIRKVIPMNSVSVFFHICHFPDSTTTESGGTGFSGDQIGSNANTALSSTHIGVR